MKSKDAPGSGVEAMQIGRLIPKWTAAVNPFKSVCRNLLRGVAALALTVALIPDAEGAVYTRFDSNFDLSSPSADWGVSQRTSGTAKTPVVIGENAMNEETLVFNRTASTGVAADSAFAYYKGTADGILNGKVADFEMSVTLSMSFLNGSTSTTFGLLIRSSSNAYNTSNGYYFAFTPGDTAKGVDAKISLFDSPVDVGTPGDPLRSTSINLQAGTNYVFKISAIGDVILASVWSVDGNTKLGELEYTGARTNAGYFGMRTGFGNSNGASLYVKDATVAAIPEPATMAFCLVGGVAMLVSFRRRNGVGTMR